MHQIENIYLQWVFLCFSLRRTGDPSRVYPCLSRTKSWGGLQQIPVTLHRKGIHVGWMDFSISIPQMRVCKQIFFPPFSCYQDPYVCLPKFCLWIFSFGSWTVIKRFITPTNRAAGMTTNTKNPTKSSCFLVGALFLLQSPLQKNCCKTELIR